MYKIGVLGKKESVMCFAPVGFEMFSAETACEALAGLSKLTELGCAIIFVTDEFASSLATECERYKKQPIPAIIEISGASNAVRT